jgi:hypothetical protein
VRRKTKALLHEQPPDDITAHYAPCAEPRHFRPSGTSWAPLGGVNRRGVNRRERMRKELAERESDVAAVRVERIGEALKKYPEYLQYDLQLKLPEIYREAGSRGNLILAAPVPPQITLPLPRNNPNPKLEAPALLK